MFVWFLFDSRWKSVHKQGAKKWDFIKELCKQSKTHESITWKEGHREKMNKTSRHKSRTIKARFRPNISFVTTKHSFSQVCPRSRQVKSSTMIYFKNNAKSAHGTWEGWNVCVSHLYNQFLTYRQDLNEPLWVKWSYHCMQMFCDHISSRQTTEPWTLLFRWERSTWSWAWFILRRSL